MANENKIRVKNYQKWLNEKGANLVVDGDFGQMTAAQTYLLFANKNVPRATMDQITPLSKTLGQVNNTRVMTVYQVEASGNAWEKNGLGKILYERHYFHRLSRGVAGVTWFSNPKAGDYTLDADKDGINDSWEKLCAASRFDILAAFQSISMSGFQIMGDHYEKLGYANPWEMLWDVCHTEEAHYRLMVRWILFNNKLREFGAISINPETCREFAKFWNGGGYATPSNGGEGYHVKLAKAAMKMTAVHGPL